MNRETAIRQTHSAVTLEALETLANKGLLRRAQKDLERGEVMAFELGDKGLVANVGGQRVTLIEAGPAKASCTCPAPGVCQHILAACLILRQETASDPAADVHAEWLALNDDDLIAFYSLPVLRLAYELSLANAAQIERSGVLTVRFPTLNAEVVALPGAGLDGTIVNGLNEKKHPQLAAAAVLAVRREAGIIWEPPMTESLRSAPVHRGDVLKAAIELLEESVATGLARLSPGLIERFDALSISARTAELHRLGLAFQRIATESADWLHRRPHADLGRIFAEMATAYALARAKPHLAAGVARESYLEIGGLDLTGVAAWPWRTPSGYEGLTVLFWDTANSSWNTWSDARPSAFAGGFSAVGRYTQAGPWEGAESPAQLAGSRFRLMQAKRNRWGRLSSSAQSKALVTGSSDLSALPVRNDWDELAVAPPLGLSEQDPRSSYQVLAPTSVVRNPFDPISQSLSWILFDKRSRGIELTISYDELAKPAIERLEKLSESDLSSASWLGRVVVRQGRHILFPLALIRGGQSESLHFGTVKEVSASVFAESRTEDDEIDEMEPDIPVGPSSCIDEVILAVLSSLEWLAETGERSQSPQAHDRLIELSNQLASVRGITHLLSDLRDAENRPGKLLRLRWLINVLQRAAG